MVSETPALVAPESGVVFGVALGTEYALRLPEAELSEAIAAGAEVSHHYRTADVTLDLASRFGPDWVFGIFDSREPEWCAAALRQVERRRK